MTTNNQHTPGPWIYDSGHFYSSAQLGPDGMTAESPIACMHSGREENYSANARLIAAAPCMYEALQRIFDGVPAYHEGEFITLHFDENGNEIGVERHDPAAIIQSILGVAQAAITKATIPSA